MNRYFNSTSTTRWVSFYLFILNTWLIRGGDIWIRDVLIENTRRYQPLKLRDFWPLWEVSSISNMIYNLSWAEAFMFLAVLGRDLSHLSLVRWQAWLWVVVLCRSYQLPLIVEAKSIMHKIMTFLETSRDLLSSFLDLVFEKSNAINTNYFITFLQITNVTFVFSK